jgi:hypothetical protein
MLQAGEGFHAHVAALDRPLSSICSQQQRTAAAPSNAAVTPKRVEKIRVAIDTMQYRTYNEHSYSSEATMATGTLAEDVHAMAQQCLVRHFRDGDEGIRTAQRELKRLEGWLEGCLAINPERRLYDDDLDRACLHTVRLLGSIARLQGRQVASALALNGSARMAAAASRVVRAGSAVVRRNPKPRRPHGSRRSCARKLTLTPCPLGSGC